MSTKAPRQLRAVAVSSDDVLSVTCRVVTALQQLTMAMAMATTFFGTFLLRVAEESYTNPLALALSME
jgi:hypothetical protein